MKISEIMTPDARCIGPDASLTAAAGMMRDLNVGALPICDHDRLAGMITDRDLAIRAVAEARDPQGTPVRAVMSPEVVYAFEDQDVEDVARIMEVKQIRRLPVLNRGKRLVGMVSLGDMATEASTSLSGEALKEISEPKRPQPKPRVEIFSPAPPSRLPIFRPAKQLNGFSLRATDGEIGHVKDLYFDDLHWQLRYFVVETGTWLKHRIVLIAPESIRAPEWDDHLLPAKLTRKEIRLSPSWDTDQPVSRQYEAALRKHYAWQPYWGSIYTDAGVGLPPPAATKPAEEISDELAGDPHLFSVNAVIGHHVIATDGEIGHVDDLLIDDERWVIRYLVVATRNWWPGNKVILSPWWTSEVNWLGRKIRMDLTRDAIKTSPPYDPEKTLTAEESGELHDYYGRTRYPGEEIGDAVIRSDNPNNP